MPAMSTKTLLPKRIIILVRACHQLNHSTLSLACAPAFYFAIKCWRLSSSLKFPSDCPPLWRPHRCLVFFSLSFPAVTESASCAVLRPTNGLEYLFCSNLFSCSICLHWEAPDTTCAAYLPLSPGLGVLFAGI